jgi:hypothetical protein
MMNTLPFLHALNDNAPSNRITFLSMMDEFDIKGKLSGKGATSRFGESVDFIGHFVQRLGYEHRRESSMCNFHGGQESDWQVAIFALNSYLKGLSLEIDRYSSTNETIKRFTQELFLRDPLTPRISYNTVWFARGKGYRIDFKYSTDITPGSL